ncbi:Txe/YoeB family addiction module toxin [Anabaena azotica]|uniref:Endoribonuclease YoeB n=1 Tax=Anabaena azotica FACHB-119 TaxID=947527 RepID=A0ABR8CYZ6_9NOST|nr:Txe/YoeB family addiction module toxin [Anabaena azotica]MBD2500145.1 Txe/YoeB family addiction module toxin [Anabaena azotica FACHB-119]
MYKQKYLHVDTPPLEASNNLDYPSGITPDSDLTVNSLYSSCLRKGNTAMTQYSDGSENYQLEYISVFTKQFKEDLKYWKKHCQAKYNRIQELIREIQSKPFDCVGKGNPEILIHEYYQGYKKRSREINGTHRLVYAVADNTIYFLQARFHYKKK